MKFSARRCLVYAIPWDDYNIGRILRFVGWDYLAYAINLSNYPCWINLV